MGTVRLGGRYPEAICFARLRAPDIVPDIQQSPEADAAFRRSLLEFYDGRARALPWRETTDPYAIWVSEIMTQQTRVETAVPYYTRWLERFPTVRALADAAEDDVLKQWEGLGYYTRARNLHRAARMVAERFDGSIPDTAQGLRDLPGVGAYTAGAVASIAFGRSEPAVDGNVRRVYARLLDEAAPEPRTVSAWVARVIDPTRPGDFNQALMELGATACVPRGPACGECPVSKHCRALAEGTVAIRPTPKVRSAVRQEARAVGVFVRRDLEGARVLLRRRPDQGLLASLWEFPSVVVGARVAVKTVTKAVRSLADEFGLALTGSGAALDPVPHAFSHLHVTYRPRVAEVDVATAEGQSRVADMCRWVTLDDAGEVALPVAQQRILQLARTWAFPDARSG